MPVIVVTRLRLSDPALFDEFFAAAVAVTEQAKNSDGNLGADVLADANNVYWTRTAWRARGPMQAFVGSEPHLATMARIDDWCDEATFIDWEQAGPACPIGRLATIASSPTVRSRVSRTPQTRIKLVPSPRPELLPSVIRRASGIPATGSSAPDTLAPRDQAIGSMSERPVRPSAGGRCRCGGQCRGRKRVAVQPGVAHSSARDER